MRSVLHHKLNLRKQCSAWLFVLAVFVVMCIANIPSQADSTTPFYAVNGTMTMTGNNVCTPSPCTETINFSFLYGYNLIYGSDYAGYVVPGSISVTSYGALGSTFSFSGLIGNLSPSCGDQTNYMPFLNSGGDEIDLDACGNIQPTPVAPSFVADLYGCGTATCANDFIPASFGNQRFGLFIPESVQTNVVRAPEGGTSLGYLLVSLAIIGLTIHRSRRVRARAYTT